MKEQIIDAYIKHCLTKGEAPKNVYVFAQELGIEEKEFYAYYASLEAIEKNIFSTWFEQVKTQLESTELYAGYSAREKFLAFYFAWIEALKNHRSFVVMLMHKQHKHMPIPSFPSFLKEFRAAYLEFAKGILSQAISANEIEDRKFLSDKYQEGMWLNLVFVMNFWTKDSSPEFEKTDEAIEKSVNLAFDLLGKSPLDTMLDFGKFLFQNK
ncbi:MAG: hypothetical protein CFE21_06195 [Bacteroidetes bacterium B1(2017)]|nr:MAG: hypothetical protein CFE21_06195 [Bacteroidetes bacterium B1(2017)]